MSLNKIFIILNIKYMSLNKIFIIFNIFRQNLMNYNKNQKKNIKKCKSKNWTANPLQPAKNVYCTCGFQAAPENFLSLKISVHIPKQKNPPPLIFKSAECHTATYTQEVVLIHICTDKTFLKFFGNRNVRRENQNATEIETILCHPI